MDLIPKTSWFDNARAALTPSDWQSIRQVVLQRAGGVCEVCQRKPFPKAKIWIEVHERWDYDAQNQTQTMKRLIALCSPCHRATHFGLAKVLGKEEQAFKHIKKVNSWSDEKTIGHIQEAFEIWQARSQMPWKVDLTMLELAGYKITKPT